MLINYSVDSIASSATSSVHQTSRHIEPPNTNVEFEGAGDIDSKTLLQTGAQDNTGKLQISTSTVEKNKVFLLFFF
jgi:hypothetical protein